MNKNKIIGLIGILLSIVGLFLPFYENGSNFLSGIGIFVLILLAVAVIFMFVFNNNKIVLILEALSFVILLFIGISEKLSNVGIGFYVIIVGLVVTAISQFLSLEKEETELEPIKEEVDLKYYEKPVKDFQRYSEVTSNGSFKMKEVKPPQINNNGTLNNSSLPKSSGLNSSGFPVGGVGPSVGMNNNNMFRKR